MNDWLTVNKLTSILLNRAQENLKTRLRNFVQVIPRKLLYKQLPLELPKPEFGLIRILDWRKWLKFKITLLHELQH